MNFEEKIIELEKKNAVLEYQIKELRNSAKVVIVDDKHSEDFDFTKVRVWEALKKLDANRHALG